MSLLIHSQEDSSAVRLVYPECVLLPLTCKSFPHSLDRVVPRAWQRRTDDYIVGMALNTKNQEILDDLSPFARITLIEKLVTHILFQEKNEMIIGLLNILEKCGLNILEKYGVERCDESEETLSTDFCQECEAPLVENIPCNCEDS